jgi:uncharacterized protein
MGTQNACGEDARQPHNGSSAARVRTITELHLRSIGRRASIKPSPLRRPAMQFIKTINGAPCWFELLSTAPETSLKFFQALFGWTAQTLDMPTGAYTMLRNANGTIGALWALPESRRAAGERSNWGAYFAVPDLDLACATVAKLGGQVVVPPMDVGQQGRMSLIADPEGALVNLWQVRPGAGGDFTMFEPFSIGWTELAGRNIEALTRFYSTLLGWAFSSKPIPGFDGLHYHEFSVDGERFGGFMPMTKEWGDMPAHWSIYVIVPDVDACLVRTAELGGSVCVPAFDAPGVGRIARIDDPTGAGCYVITPKGG